MILLFQRQKEQNPVDQEKNLKEMEDLLLSYTAEMKENNERLVKMVLKEKGLQRANELKQQTEQTQKSPKPSITHVDVSGVESTKVTEEKNETKEEELPMLKDEEKYKDYAPPTPKEEEHDTTPSDTSRVLSLHQQGYTVMEIAQKLNMGIAEVDLLLKFHK